MAIILALFTNLISQENGSSPKYPKRNTLRQSPMPLDCYSLKQHAISRFVFSLIQLPKLNQIRKVHILLNEQNAFMHLFTNKCKGLFQVAFGKLEKPPYEFRMKKLVWIKLEGHSSSIRTSKRCTL